MTTLDKKKAFFHVIDSHRWLAASGCTWNQIKPGGPEEGKFDQNLPNIIVMVRDCLLLHARSLIKFYRSRGRQDDIVLCDFGIASIPPALDAKLHGWERPIEVHLLHLTDWRDPDYRNSHTATRGTANRPDWDREGSVIAEALIVECLGHASQQGGNWQAPFKLLFDATTKRYQDRSHSWPQKLGGWTDVENYLKGLGL